MPKKPIQKRNANGEGCITKLPNRELYRGQVTIEGQYDENGKQIRKTVYGKTITECQQKMTAVKYEIKTGLFLDKDEITIYQLARQMLDDDLNYGTIVKSTYTRYLDTLKRLKPIYNTPLQRSSVTQLKGFLQQQTHYSQEVIDKMFAMLKRTFKEALRRKIIKENPFDELKKPKSQKKKVKVRALTIDEQKKLFDVLISEDINYSRQMLISMLTGMRMGEVSALSVKDINFRFRTVTINKTVTRGEDYKAYVNNTTKTQAGERIILLSENVEKVFRDAIGDKKPDELIFTNGKGEPVSTNQINAQYSRVLKKYDIIDKDVDGRVDLHSLRHTYATRAIENGMPVKLLSKSLGHTDVRITLNTYCDAFNRYEAEHTDNFNAYMNNLGMKIDYTEHRENIGA